MILIGFIIIFSYGVGNVAAANSSNIYVNSSSGNDSWDGQLAVWNGTSGPKATIKNATGSVNNDGTINIADGIYSGPQNTNITIYKNMNINGQSQDGTIINGTNKNYIFSISPGINLTITNLTLSNGCSIMGGAILCAGNLTINNCNFEYNNGTGSAISETSNGCILFVNNSNFTNNIGNSAISTDYDTYSTIDNCTFANNGNEMECGAIANGGFLTIISCKFIDNTASIGGAICSGSPDNMHNSTLEIYNTSFTGNNAENAGVLDIGGGIVTIDNCDFSSNNATICGVIENFGAMSINNSRFTNNNATRYVGVIINGNILNVTNSTFTNNTGDNGSAIWNGDILNVSNSIFINNTANSGGLIFNGLSNDNETVIMNFNRIIGNTGYAIYDKYGSVDASLNWWGSNSGPLTGDIYGNVTTSPWLTITAKATPNGGSYNTNQIVNLTMNLPGTIYYTLDGSNPTTSSSNYIAPISININTVLKYFAVDSAGDQSPIYTDNYTLDTIPPTANANIKSGSYNIIQTIILKMSEPGKIYYTLNGTIPTSTSTQYTKPITISTTSTLKYLAIDLASNKSPIYVQNYLITPTIIKTNPKYDAINIPLTTPLTITFSENIIKAINYNNIYVKNVNTGKLVQITKTLSKNKLTIKMTKSRLHNDKYIIYIPKDAFKDLGGNQTVAYTIKFKTG
ncbi:chitobiase/beta-hexosaminidase C-terminal domain-containing protein [Methanobacterium sp.]|uniref:chitobiase/beta-hexosaminidase C-terminal domain-containing protein n=1 Tax=Methanobacterium sp. TaxID=2164 RepID=UPI003C71A034